MHTHNTSIEVIKQKGLRPSEYYCHEKLHQSLRSSLLSVRALEGEAEDITHRVCLRVAEWCQHKTAITTQDIRRVAAKILAKYHTEAAYVYEQQEFIL